MFRQDKLSLPEIKRELRYTTDEGKIINAIIIKKRTKDEICPFCKKEECLMDCEASQEDASDRDIEISEQKATDIEEFKIERFADDILDSIILAHFMEGIDVATPAYLKGIQTTIDAITSNIANYLPSER